MTKSLILEKLPIYIMRILQIKILQREREKGGRERVRERDEREEGKVI